MTEVSWNATRLASASAMGVLLFIINVASGLLIVMATGIPLAGAVVMAFIVGILWALTALIIPLFPSVTIMTFVYGVLALPTPISGPPGFVPKILVTVSAGITVDIIMLLLRKRNEKVGVVTASAIGAIVAMAVFGATFYLFLPETVLKKFLPVFPILFAISVIEAIPGAYVGYKIFQKIRTRSIVVRLRGE
jgi:hypothetical protein